jgi:prepilin-type N-terminal cleavage/methylation domain-containing protein
MRSQKGFTLIEVMLVLAIMATLAVLATQSMQQAISSKNRLQTTLSEMSRVRDALKIIERDFNLAYHDTDLETEVNRLIREKRKKECTVGSSGGGTTTTTNTAGKCPPLDANGCLSPEDPLCKTKENRVAPNTEFLGTETEAHFATLNTGRVTEASASADFIKVGYSLRACTLPGNQERRSQCLLRRSSPYVEGRIDRGGEEVILLEDVEEFSLRYFGPGKQDWNREWNSVQGDAVTKGRYPDLVEISLTAAKGEGEKKRKVSMQIVAQVRFSNNPHRTTTTR